LKDGRVVAGRGSLAEILPNSLRDLFARAALPLSGITTLAWTGPSGTTYEWRVCLPAISNRVKPD
jgi:hypothetical protein